MMLTGRPPALRPYLFRPTLSDVGALAARFLAFSLSLVLGGERMACCLFSSSFFRESQCDDGGALETSLKVQLPPAVNAEKASVSRHLGRSGTRRGRRSLLACDYSQVPAKHRLRPVHLP